MPAAGRRCTAHRQAHGHAAGRDAFLARGRGRVDQCRRVGRPDRGRRPRRRRPRRAARHRVLDDDRAARRPRPRDARRPRRPQRRDRARRRPLAPRRRRSCSRSPRCPPCAAPATVGPLLAPAGRARRRASSRSARSALAVPVARPGGARAARPAPPTRCSPSALAFCVLLAHRAMRTFALTRRPADLLVASAASWLGVALVRAADDRPGTLGFYLGHVLELAGVALVGDPGRAATSRAPAPRARSSATSRATELVAAEEAYLGPRVRALMVAPRPSATARPRSTPAASRCSPSQVGEELKLPAARAAATSPSAGCCTTSASSPCRCDDPRKPGALDRRGVRGDQAPPEAGVRAAATSSAASRRRSAASSPTTTSGSTAAATRAGWPASELDARDAHPRRLRRLRRARLRPRLPRGLDAERALRRCCSARAARLRPDGRRRARARRRRGRRGAAPGSPSLARARRRPLRARPIAAVPGSIARWRPRRDVGSSPARADSEAVVGRALRPRARAALDPRPRGGPGPPPNPARRASRPPALGRPRRAGRIAYADGRAARARRRAADLRGARRVALLRRVVCNRDAAAATPRGDGASSPAACSRRLDEPDAPAVALRAATRRSRRARVHRELDACAAGSIAADELLEASRSVRGLADRDVAPRPPAGAGPRRAGAAGGGVWRCA